jgi:uncharacterized protein
MIVGRKKERALFETAFESDKAQFITIYGRRRVGKTYLVRQFFSQKKCLFFEVTGVQHGNMKRQIEGFYAALSETFFNRAPLAPAASWFSAFMFLHDQILKSEGKVIIFLDELPWLAARRSGLMQEISYYWNRYWSKMPQVILIVCGSSASWILQKILFDRGGLHNRTTVEIKLKPFSLSETKEFLENKGVLLNENQVLSLYMALGGVPYYLDYVEPGNSAHQTIQKLFFDPTAPLKEEFEKLFESLFNDAEPYKEIITILAEKKDGVERAELVKRAKFAEGGGRLTQRLRDLTSAGFIEPALSWEKKQGEFYRVIDEFSLFYLRWVAQDGRRKFVPQHWIKQSQKPAYCAWSGYAFEAVCIKHIDVILNALGIESALYYGWWRYVPKTANEHSVQVDLIIDRTDDALTVCEIKYTEEPFIIDKSYAEKLNKVLKVFQEQTGSMKQLFLAMMSASGVKKNVYSEKMITGVVTLKDLFKHL